MRARGGESARAIEKKEGQCKRREGEKRDVDSVTRGTTKRFTI